MKNPTRNRMIGYIMLMVGIIIWYKGFHYPTVEDSVNGHSSLLITISVLVIVAATIWLIRMVRCPHCHKLLSIRLRNIDICPYCGKHTDDKEEES